MLRALLGQSVVSRTQNWLYVESHVQIVWDSDGDFIKPKRLVYMKDKTHWLITKSQ